MPIITVKNLTKIFIRRYQGLLVNMTAISLFIVLTASASSVKAEFNTPFAYEGGTFLGYFLKPDCSDWFPYTVPGGPNDTYLLLGCTVGDGYNGCNAYPNWFWYGQDSLNYPYYDNSDYISEAWFEKVDSFLTSCPNEYWGVYKKRIDCETGATRPCYDGPAGTEDVGTCRAGTETCINQQWGRSGCQNEITPQAEVCDGLDHNCNGILYDGFFVCQPGEEKYCYDGPTGTDGVGECRGGTATCTSSCQWDSVCNGEVLPQAEICDGLDNNCNGQIDEGFECKIGNTKHCYGGLAGTEGVGNCRGGTQVCNGICQWDPICTGEVRPQVEICDGQDNDCDGVIDNGFECTASKTKSCYDGPAATRGVGSCRDGTLDCINCQWDTSCQGQVLPGEEKCDGQDGNCDGIANCLNDDSGQNEGGTCPLQ